MWDRNTKPIVKGKIYHKSVEKKKKKKVPLPVETVMPSNPIHPTKHRNNRNHTSEPEIKQKTINKKHFFYKKIRPN